MALLWHQCCFIPSKLRHHIFFEFLLCIFVNVMRWVARIGDLTLALTGLVCWLWSATIYQSRHPFPKAPNGNTWAHREDWTVKRCSNTNVNKGITQPRLTKPRTTTISTSMLNIQREQSDDKTSAHIMYQEYINTTRAHCASPKTRYRLHTLHTPAIPRNVRNIIIPGRCVIGL